MTAIPMNEPVTSFPQAALLAIVLAGRYRPGRHHHHNGFRQHVIATSPWPGAITVALIVLVGLVLALIKKAGRVLQGTPWYVRLALLVTAGIGIFRLLSRKKQATPQGIWHAADGWEPRPATGPDRVGSPPDRRPPAQAAVSPGAGSYTRAALAHYHRHRAGDGSVGGCRSPGSGRCRCSRTRHVVRCRSAAMRALTESRVGYAP